MRYEGLIEGSFDVGNESCDFRTTAIGSNELTDVGQPFED